MDGLQLVKFRLCASKTQGGRLLHQTQLGVDVAQLVRVAQRMPIEVKTLLVSRLGTRLTMLDVFQDWCMARPLQSTKRGGATESGGTVPSYTFTAGIQETWLLVWVTSGEIRPSTPIRQSSQNIL